MSETQLTPQRAAELARNITGRPAAPERVIALTRQARRGRAMTKEEADTLVGRQYDELAGQAEADEIFFTDALAQSFGKTRSDYERLLRRATKTKNQSRRRADRLLHRPRK